MEDAKKARVYRDELETFSMFVIMSMSTALTLSLSVSLSLFSYFLFFSRVPKQNGLKMKC